MPQDRSLDWSQFYKQLGSQLEKAPTFLDGMAAILEYCTKEQPDPVWRKIQKLYSPRGYEQFRTWLPTPFKLDPPPAGLKAYWMGIFHPSSDRASGMNVDCYIAGADKFTEADPNWPCSPTWFPEGRYCNSPVLAPLADLCYETKPRGWLDIVKHVSEAFVAFAWKHALKDLGPATFLRGEKELGLGFGWDSGDLLILGKLSAEGVRIDPTLGPG